MRRTILHDRHLAGGAKMVEFAGWQMPIQYATGIVEEHLRTRKSAGLFDISHMGRFLVSGRGSLPFLQHVCTGDAEALRPGQAQYTMIPDAHGWAIDDAYLYRLEAEAYQLVVNAANREKDWSHLQGLLPGFPDVACRDQTDEVAMLSLQGPASPRILCAVLGEAALPEPGRNNLTRLSWGGAALRVARTGYTGEPLGFEVFVPAHEAGPLWDAFTAEGAAPVGLGARDTLRLEAGLPLYGHELGADPGGAGIPIFACPLARFAVSLTPRKGEFIGRSALERQAAVYRRIANRDFADQEPLPRLVRLFALLEAGVARQGAALYQGGRPAGWVTSGTMAPYWIFTAGQQGGEITARSDKRAIGMCMVDVTIDPAAELEVEVRGRRLRARTVPRLLNSQIPPYARPVLSA
jgi:aminomethyltransferase